MRCSYFLCDCTRRNEQSKRARTLFEWGRAYRGYTCFITLASCVRGGCQWYANRGGTFPPISRYILLPCNRWQQRGTLTKWRLSWKCGWNKGVSLNSSQKQKWAPTDIHRCSLYISGDQTVDVNKMRQ